MEKNNLQGETEDNARSCICIPSSIKFFLSHSLLISIHAPTRTEFYPTRCILIIVTTEIKAIREITHHASTETYHHILASFPLLCTKFLLRKISSSRECSVLYFKFTGRSKIICAIPPRPLNLIAHPTVYLTSENHQSGQNDQLIIL